MASSSATLSSIIPNQTGGGTGQGSWNAPVAGIVGGYTGNSLTLIICMAFFAGLAFYNSIELMILIFVTFNRYKGLYFWSLIVAGLGPVPYQLGFLLKYFQIINNNDDQTYIAVTILTIGWYAMITGQSVVLWSRLHLVVNSRRILRWTLTMIIVDAIIFHVPTTILTYGSNSNHFTPRTLSHFTRGYNIMEKIQMVGFFLQECIISIIYIKETIQLLRVGDKNGIKTEGLTSTKIMYQLIAINILIIAMDIAVLSLELANLYILQTTMKGAVYSIKCKLEFAVLSRLVQMVTTRTGSSSLDRNARDTNPLTDKEEEQLPASSHESHGSHAHYPSFVNPSLIEGDVTHAIPLEPLQMVGTSSTGRRRSRARGGSWIEQEMDKHNIG